MKPKFAITCIVLLIVANLSVVYFRSCNEGFKVKKKKEEEEKEEEEDDEKDPCKKVEDRFNMLEYVVSNIAKEKDDRKKELMRLEIAKSCYIISTSATDNKCIDKATDKEKKAMDKYFKQMRKDYKSKGSGLSSGSSMGSSFGL